jgi:Zn-dependent protease with chaperone function
MTDPTTAYDRSGIAVFRAEVFLPFDRARSVGGWVETSANTLVVTARGERFELAPGSTTITLGGHNGERVVVESEIATGSPRAGERLYLQCPDHSLLAHLAAHGPPELRARAAQLSRKGRAVSRRWLIFLIVAAVMVVVGASLLYLFLDVVVKRAVSRIPIAWENRLGESLFSAMTAGRPRAQEKDAAVVKAAFERLRAHTTSPGYEFEYAVLESPEVNAFALPGGKFIVLSGLLAKAGRPEEVAGVLGHEFEHAVLRHSLQKMVRAAGLQAVLALLVGDLEGLGGAVRDAGVQIQELSYGRDQEREADLAAIDLLANAGIDPAGLPDFFDRLAAQQGGSGSGTGGKALTLLSTHPASTERSAALRAAIARRSSARYEPLLVP